MVRKYFAGANTASGYISLMENNLKDIKNTYTLSGESKKLKTEIMAHILSIAENNYEHIECIVNPFDITQIDAVIIRDIKTTVLDNDVYLAEKRKKVFNLKEKRRKYSEEIEKIAGKRDMAFDMLYKAYQKGKIIHDEWEKIYIENMDFSRLEAYGEGVINELIGNRRGNEGTQNYHRLFGASTPDGSVNYIDNLTDDISARYFIKGRPGTGKSTFLKKLAKKANENGFDTEIYYCSFDKDSLDMVIVPELSFCVFDSTAPHEMFPSKERDKILDFYQESGLFGTDEKFEKSLEDVAQRYRQKVAEGMAYLRLGKLYMKELEYNYLKDIDEEMITKLKEKVSKEILGT